MNITIFASGNGSNLQAIINACKYKKLNANVSCVISNNENSMTIQRAKNENIPHYYLNKNNFKSEKEYIERTLNILSQHNTDIIFLTGYLQIINPTIIEKYKNKIFNIHPSLLPKYGGKGMFGINIHKAVIAAKETETGITIHKVSNEYDKGEIIAQKIIKINDNDTPESLSKRVLKIEHTFIIETLNKIIKNYNKTV